ncbi:MAG: tetratricopeptide repeat protein [Fuerstiella sp.]
MPRSLRRSGPSSHLFRLGVLLFLLLTVGGIINSVFTYRRLPRLRVGYAADHQQLLETGTTGDTVSALRTAAAINFEDGFSQLQLVSTAYAAGDTDGIVLGLRGLLNHSPDDAELHGELAIVLLRTGRLEEALIHTRRAIALDPNVAGIYVTQGAIMLSLGRNQEAADSYRKALELNPDSEAARRALNFPLKNY